MLVWTELKAIGQKGFARESDVGITSASHIMVLVQEGTSLESALGSIVEELRDLQTKALPFQRVPNPRISLLSPDET